MKRLGIVLATLGLIAAAPGPTWFPSTRGQPVVICLERTPCFGRCPIYKVEIRGDGLVTYEGQNFVSAVGKRTRRISPAAVQRLLGQFRAVGFFGLKDSYRGNVTDLPSAIVTLSIGRHSKRVEDYAGQMAGMPPAVDDLEAAIDREAGTASWIGHP